MCDGICIPFHRRLITQGPLLDEDEEPYSGADYVVRYSCGHIAAGPYANIESALAQVPEQDDATIVYRHACGNEYTMYTWADGSWKVPVINWDRLDEVVERYYIDELCSMVEYAESKLNDGT